MRRDDHDVRADVKLRMNAARVIRFVRDPRAHIHVGDADAIDARLLSREAHLNPAQKNRVEAARLVVRITGNRRQACPLTGPLRKTRYSPPGFEGQSSSVASLVTKVGPARSASAIFSASLTGSCVEAFWASNVAAIR